MGKIMVIRKLVVVILVFVGVNSIAQNVFRAGIMPEVNISTKLSGDLKLTGNIESRIINFDYQDEANGTFKNQYQLIDASIYLSQKLNLNQSLSVGYLLRSRENKIFHRFIQQYSIVSGRDALRLGHRFALDQTLDPDGNWEIRTRYRITAEKPLSGDNIDSKEFYLKAGNEYLGIFEGNESDLEIRLMLFLGYEVNSQSKIEFGPDYRFSDFTGNGIDHVVWMNIGWYYRIN